MMAGFFRSPAFMLCLITAWVSTGLAYDGIVGDYSEREMEHHVYVMSLRLDSVEGNMGQLLSDRTVEAIRLARVMSASLPAMSYFLSTFIATNSQLAR